MGWSAKLDLFLQVNPGSVNIPKRAKGIPFTQIVVANCLDSRQCQNGSAFHGCATVQTFKEAESTCIVFKSLWLWVVSK